MNQEFTIKVNLRKKLVIVITEQIINYSFDKESTSSINKLACFAASNIIDYYLFRKDIFHNNIDTAPKIVKKVKVKLCRNFKNNSLFIKKKGWIGSNTSELTSLIIKDPVILFSGINLEYDYDLIEMENPPNDIYEISNKIIFILKKYGIKTEDNLPSAFINFIFFIKYHLSKADIFVDKSFVQKLKKLELIYFSDPWQIDNYLFRKILDIYKINNQWLPHGTTGYHFNSHDEILSHLIWMGSNCSLYSNSNYSLKINKPIISIGDLKNTILKQEKLSDSLEIDFAKNKTIGIVVFPLGDLNSYPHYQSNTFFQVHILKKLMPFLIKLNIKFKLYFLLHPSITTYYKKWLKESISSKLDGNYFFGTFDKFQHKCKDLIFTYMGSTTFHDSLKLNKNVTFLSFTYLKNTSKKNILIDSKYSFSEYLISLDLRPNDISEYLMTSIFS